MNSSLGQRLQALEAHVHEAVLFMQGQNMATGFVACVRTAAMNDPEQLRDGLSAFLADTLTRPEHELPEPMRRGVKSIVESYVASLTVAIEHAKKSRRRSIKRIFWRVAVPVLLLVGWKLTPLRDKIPEMWQSVVDSFIEELVSTQIPGAASVLQLRDGNDSQS